jgi:hypothetical protein
MTTESEKSWVAKGNREVITDYYVPKTVTDERNSLRFKVFVRLNAKDVTFRNVSFLHCVFEGCYINSCVFDSCDFTGCRFVGSNFHQTTFAGCDFKYATFERTQIDSDILDCEAPREENLRMHFARSLRMNYQQLGDAKAVNKAISIELGATSAYLYKSWISKETYYKKKYNGFFIRTIQFLRWVEFWVLHTIWGNGESILKLMRSLMVVLISITIYDTSTNGNPLDLSQYWTNFTRSPAIFLGVELPKNFSTGILSIITGIKFVSFALFTTLLVKRFSRR